MEKTTPPFASVEASSPQSAFDEWWESQDLGACCPFSVYVFDPESQKFIQF